MTKVTFRALGRELGLDLEDSWATYHFMRRVDDYRQNAEACRKLALEMPPKVRDDLLSMAREWEQLAEERERTLNAMDSQT